MATVTRCVTALLALILVVAGCRSQGDVVSTIGPGPAADSEVTRDGRTSAFGVDVGDASIDYPVDGQAGEAALAITRRGTVVISAPGANGDQLILFDQAGNEMSRVVLPNTEAVVDVAAGPGVIAVLTADQSGTVGSISAYDDELNLIETDVLPSAGGQMSGVTGLFVNDDGSVVLELFDGASVVTTGVDGPVAEATYVAGGHTIERVVGAVGFAVGGTVVPVPKRTEFGAVQFLGVGPDRSLYVWVEEVEGDRPDAVIHRVLRLNFDGSLVAEIEYETRSESGWRMHALAVGGDGRVYRLRGMPEVLVIEPLELRTP